MLGNLGHVLALGQQPVSFPQLAHDLLGGVAASLHRVLLPIRAVGLSYQVDQSQWVRSTAAGLRPKRSTLSRGSRWAADELDHADNHGHRRTMKSEVG